ncbi:hypothetical protein TNCV_3254031, partial [Trichonephila clavipes]
MGSKSSLVDENRNDISRREDYDSDKEWVEKNAGIYLHFPNAS